MDRMHGRGPIQGHGQDTDQRHAHIQTGGSAHPHEHGQGQHDGYGGGQVHGHPQQSPTQGRLIRWARLYDPFVWLMSAGRTRALRKLPLGFAALKPGERVLDVGCGTGDVTLGAVRQVGPTGKVVGIDAAPEMISEANRKAKGVRGGSVQFLVEPVEALSFPDASFDVALSSLMMHHLPGDLKRRALAEVKRVLRPGGRIVIVDFQPTAAPPSIWQPGGFVARMHGRQVPTTEQVQAGLSPLAALLREAGFADVKHGTTRQAWLGYVLGKVPE